MYSIAIFPVLESNLGKKEGYFALRITSGGDHTEFEDAICGGG
jgi:hypothetical protein